MKNIFTKVKVNLTECTHKLPAAQTNSEIQI